MTNKEIKLALQIPGTKFEFKFPKSYTQTVDILECFKDDYAKGNIVGSIGKSWAQMNVSKWGPTCVWLYSYDMFNNRTIGKIPYRDITIIDKT